MKEPDKGVLPFGGIELYSRPISMPRLTFFVVWNDFLFVIDTIYSIPVRYPLSSPYIVTTTARTKERLRNNEEKQGKADHTSRTILDLTLLTNDGPLPPSIY